MDEAASAERVLYTEAISKCFLPKTQFVNVDGVATYVADLSPGDEVQGPGPPARIESITRHEEIIRVVIEFSVVCNGTTVALRVTHAHRMAVPNFAHQTAEDLMEGDWLCTSEGELKILAIGSAFEETSVFEVSFAEDRPAYMAICIDQGIIGVMAAVYGSEQDVPYDSSEFAEFRLRGQIYDSMGKPEQWFERHGLIVKFELKFWASQVLAVWVPKQLADLFFDEVKPLLPRCNGNRIRLRRVRPTLSDAADGSRRGVCTARRFEPLAPVRDRWADMSSEDEKIEPSSEPFAGAILN